MFKEHKKPLKISLHKKVYSYTQRTLYVPVVYTYCTVYSIYFLSHFYLEKPFMKYCLSIAANYTPLRIKSSLQYSMCNTVCVGRYHTTMYGIQYSMFRNDLEGGSHLALYYIWMVSWYDLGWFKGFLWRELPTWQSNNTPMEKGGGGGGGGKDLPLSDTSKSPSPRKKGLI